MGKKKSLDELLATQDSSEEVFVKANEFLTNDVLNEIDENEDLDEFEEKDNMLLDKLRSLDGKKAKRLRTEFVKNELDVNITSKNDSNSIHKIRPSDLLNSLKDISESGELKKLFSKAQSRTKVLDTPLPKYLSEKAQRLAAYTDEKKEVSKWDPVIKRNRMSEQLVFPLKQPDYSLQTASSFTKTWKAETEMEKQISELLETSENNLKDQKLLTQAEMKALQSMSLEEMKQKRSEFLKLKALQMYQEAKFKRLKNIKSKRYRKILKKQREKEEKKQMEALEKSDPAQFKEVVKQMEKDRMKERMSLKHKNTSKWAKQQAQFAKYNDKAREQVQEQLEISKNLTKKLSQFEVKESSDEEQETNKKETVNLTLQTATLDNNPWMKMMSGVTGTQTEENKDSNKNEYSQPKAFIDKKNKNNIDEEEELESEIESEDDLPEKENLKDVSNVLIESDLDEKEEKIDEEKIKKNKKAEKCVQIIVEETKKIPETKESHVEVNIKPMRNEIKSISSIKKSSDSHQLTLSEAFADDDVVQEFKAEKKLTIENERVKQIDLSLPGWGDWAGAGIDPNETKKTQKKRNKKLRKKLIIRPQDVLTTKEDREQMERRDKNLEHVIISEKKDTKIAEFQINQLPHQFNNVHDFENKISQPIGRTWNPDFKFRKMIQPKVKTKIGSVIEPIDKDDIVKNIKKNKK
ncbi:unnamed protein product [Brachionus calyciflorus]|uniref:UTP14A n=1 Tax=Brachionus calyciflorus TaxID=104777 RepID=A0A814KUK4_9BILA|nr:unnamed protein product [Brachionus calyciflorus]